MNPVLEKFIATRDRQIMAKDVTAFTPPLAEYFAKLECAGSVVVGGRTSCGGAVDPTWTRFTKWNEVIRKARALGYSIDVLPIKHLNGSPTRAGGFWNENEYRLASKTGSVQESA